MSLGPRTPLASDYHVGWICAIQTEYVVAQELLDDEYDPPELSSADENVYKFGRIGFHNVVVACLPKGVYGVPSAAAVAVNMLRSFSELDIKLMVGVGGGAPSSRTDVRLGDVVVSVPTAHASGLIHYNYGRSVQDKRLVQTAYIDGPPQKLLAAIQNLATTHERKGHNIRGTIDAMIQKNRRLRKKYTDPGPANDILFKSDFEHPPSAGGSCDACTLVPDVVVQRVERDIEDDSPAVHYGLIASANQLMKDARTRDQLAREERVLCFEMEAAGLSRNFPCLVIRGICDYSDSHKNDLWQGYAAATAAAYAKELLQFVSPVVDSNSISGHQSIHSLSDTLVPVSRTDSMPNPTSERCDGWVSAQVPFETDLSRSSETESSTDASSVILQAKSHPNEGSEWPSDVSNSSNGHLERRIYPSHQGIYDANVNTTTIPLRPAVRRNTDQESKWDHIPSYRERQNNENHKTLHNFLDKQQLSVMAEVQGNPENVESVINKKEIASQKAQRENANSLRSTLSGITIDNKEKLQRTSRLLYKALDDNSASSEQRERKAGKHTMDILQQAISNTKAQTRSNRHQLPTIIADKPMADKKKRQKNAANLHDFLFSKKRSPASPPSGLRSVGKNNQTSELPAVTVQSPTSSATRIPQPYDQDGQPAQTYSSTVCFFNLPPAVTNNSLMRLIQEATGVNCKDIQTTSLDTSTREVTLNSPFDARTVFQNLDNATVVGRVISVRYI